MPTERNLGRFGALLAALIGMMLVASWVYETDHEGPLFSVGSSALLLISLYAVSRERRYFGMGLALVLPALVTRWTWSLTGLSFLLSLYMVFTVAFLFLAIGLILNEVRKDEFVDADTVLGGVCVYLLLGVAFMFGHALVEHLAPGSYQIAGAPIVAWSAGPGENHFVEFLYFSIVTMTTLGYGDILPLGSTARIVAGTEAMFGQLFLAIFIARLVGLYTAQAHTQREGGVSSRAPSTG
jgi:hypothetical protein